MCPRCLEATRADAPSGAASRTLPRNFRRGRTLKTLLTVRAANILEPFPADPNFLYAECRRTLDVLASWAEAARTLAEVLGYTR